MKAIIVLSVDLPKPEDAVKIIKAIDPPNIPFFTGEARIAVGPDAQHVINYLDGNDDA